MLEKILTLGDPRLYEISTPVQADEITALQPQIDLLHQLVRAFQERYGAGRAIAAPQIGLMKRIICYNVDQPLTLINPVLSELSEEMFSLWDDCMSFPNLLVKVKRHRRCRITFRDENWQEHSWLLEDDLSELFQHEYDHLDGILATQRAIDERSFKWIRR
jgi:peptide deformylase